MKKMIGLFTIIITMLLCCQAYASNNNAELDVISINDDFENSNMSNWMDDTGRGIKTIESDNNEKYMALTSNSNSYFNFQAKDIYSTDKLYIKTDIKFTSNSAEMQLRESRDISSAGFTMAGRLRKNAYYLEYFSNGTYNKMLDSNGNWLQINDVSKWYTIKMIFDVKVNKYSIYLLDRDTQTLISKSENLPFYGECKYINYLSFSSSYKLCIDNVLVQDIAIKTLILKGNQYPKIPLSGQNTYNYSIHAVYENGVGLELESMIWSIKYPKTGVSIDSDTGILSIQNTAVPGPVLIHSEKPDQPFLNGTFLIDLER